MHVLSPQHLPYRQEISRLRLEARTTCKPSISKADALYLRLLKAKIIESEEVQPGIVLDFDEQGRIVGIEILDASEHVAAGRNFMRLTTT